MHRASFRTVAACEAVAWRRALYAENNPGVLIYDDVCTLTADRILADLGYLPQVVVGSPPCQDISPANTKGKGVEGERSGLYFEAVRIIGEVRPRWFALENSANLRTRGADAVLAALEGIGYTCWAFVVRAGDIGANHERARSWIIGCDLEQVADPNGDAIRVTELSQRSEPEAAVAEYAAGYAEEDGRGAWRQGGCSEPASGISVEACRHADDADALGQRSEGIIGSAWRGREDQEPEHSVDALANANGEGEPYDTVNAEMGRGDGVGIDAPEPWADWNGSIAHHLRVDDRLSAWVAQSRIAVGGPRGTSAASLIVEAFGDAVVPQIPEAIGRAILRVEEALAAVYMRSAA